MKLMTFNILANGEKEAGDRQGNIQQVIARHSPDILCMQEGGAGDFWEGMIKENNFVFSENAEGAYHPSVYSRHPVSEYVTVDFFNPGGIYFKIPFRDAQLIVLNVHLPWKVTADTERLAILDELLSTYCTDSNQYICICGDFNSRSAGEYGEEWQVKYLSSLSGLAQTVSNDEWVAATDFVKMHGFTDSYRYLHSARGYSQHHGVEEMRQRHPEMLQQFSQDDIKGRFLPAGIRVDYIFVNDKLLSCLSSCDIDDAPFTFNSSDHSPVIAEFHEG